MKLLSIILGCLLATGTILKANETEKIVDAVKRGNQLEFENLWSKATDRVITDDTGKTITMLALERNHFGIVKRILEKGVSSCSVDQNGNSELIYAVLSRNEEMVRLIANQCNINLERKNGETALDLANSMGYATIANELKKNDAKSNQLFSGNLTLITYTLYLVISIIMTIWVARTLFINGKVFLLDSLVVEELANSVNRLLVVGFYLINIGFITLALKMKIKPNNPVESFETLSSKIGFVLLVLGGMHFFNLFMFGRLKKKTSEKRAAMKGA
ncbi:MAG: ankyrin repeat domain-containing protein [Leptospiraceae bacterium]|nr:ankyrin repeat domain-containing protein [Leptospiraceae bacterium]